MKNYQFLIFILIGVVLIGGASMLLRPGGGEEIIENEIDEIIETETLAESPTAAGQVIESPTMESTLENTAEAAIPPTPRLGLESTDPASVELASGKLQLVEIFAFW
jgi:hypothetical protein